MTGNVVSPEAIEKVLVSGDLAKLDIEQRLSYYKSVCESIGLNPLTQPFEYISLNGKLRLYAKKDATDQLRRLYEVSVDELKHDFKETVDLYIVTAIGHNRGGRKDASTGAVNVSGLKGEALANAIMKAETKAKRRLTLSICGLGMLDESEIDAVPEYPPPAPPRLTLQQHVEEKKQQQEPVQKTDEAPAPATKRRKKSEATVTELVNNPAVVEKLREEGLQIDHEELKKATSKSTEFSFGANAPVPAEGPETAQVPLAPSSPSRFEADDSDVPDNIGTPKYDRDTVKTLEREIEATGDNRFVGHKIDEFPSKEERNEIAKRLRAFGIDMQQLGDFVKKTSGKTDTREITKSAWAGIFARLDGALDEEDRKQIVLGK